MKKNKKPGKDAVVSSQEDALAIGLLHNFIMFAGFTALRMAIIRESSGPEEAKELFNKILDSWANVTKGSITMEVEKMHSAQHDPFQQMLAKMLDDMGGKKLDVEELHVAHVKAVNTVVSKMKEMVKWEETDNSDENIGF